MKKLKFKVKGWLLVKIAKYRREIKAYKKRLAEDVVREQDYIDKITLLENEIRDLILKLNPDDKNRWLKDHNKKGVRK